MKIRQKTKEYTFVDDVRTHMKPKEAAPAANDQTDKNALPFGKPGEPVDVASNRLDIDDLKKTALYTGQVVATQAGATMTSPEMTVTYEGTVAPESKDGTPNTSPSADAADASGTKVNQIVAKDLLF